MGCCPTRVYLGPCPNCGTGEAYMSSSVWGHDHSCCSDACGMAFRDSSRRWKLEVESARSRVYWAKKEHAEAKRCLVEALDREAALGGAAKGEG